MNAHAPQVQGVRAPTQVPQVAAMQQTIESIDVVSDGIVVQFRDGIRCYYPAAFLLDHANTGSNQVFLDHDPTPAPAWDLDALADPRTPKPRLVF